METTLYLITEELGSWKTEFREEALAALDRGAVVVEIKRFVFIVGKTTIEVSARLKCN